MFGFICESPFQHRWGFPPTDGLYPTFNKSTDDDRIREREKQKSDVIGIDFSRGKLGDDSFYYDGVEIIDD